MNTNNAPKPLNNELMTIGADIINTNDIGIIVINSERNICCWNKWMVDKSSISQKHALNKPLSSIFSQLTSLRLFNAIEDVFNNSMSSVLSSKFNPEILPLYTDNSKQQKLSQQLIIKPVQQNNYCLIQVFDVTSAIARDNMLRRQTAASKNKELYTRTILSSIADAVITTDEKGIVDYVNRVAEDIMECSVQDLINKPLKNVFCMLDQDSSPVKLNTEQLLNTDLTTKNLGTNLTLKTSQGNKVAIEESIAPIKNSNGQVLGLVIVFRDVSNARKLVEQVNWQASHDGLTGLVNRSTFDKQLCSTVDAVKNTRQQHTLLYLDLDQFKIVNDTCGHIAGDELLKQISKTIQEKIRNNDILARLGGDEFGILLQNCPTGIAKKIANNIRHAIRDFRFGWGDNSFQIGVSIGLVEINEHTLDVKRILSAADTACYAAKDNGRNQVHIYDFDKSDAADRHGEMEWYSKIQQALEENRFCLFGQAIAPTNDPSKIEHIEVLIRMLDTDKTLLPPGSFIPAAERFDLMGAIDRWVVKNVFLMYERSKAAILDNKIKFAINLSGNTLSDKETLLYIVDQLIKFEIPANLITFEITETAAISNLSAASTFIKTLKRQGCLFSLDDFGSGLSSFAYLKNLQVDFLKIDGTFIKDIVDDPIDFAMVKSINQIGHVMKLETIAEFVENDEILEVLTQLKVDHAQGYGIAKPKPLMDQSGKFIF